MAITSITITNPGAETGDTTGWTQSTGTGFSAVTSPAPYAGTYSFKAGNAATCVSFQTVAVPAPSEAAIDAGDVAFKLGVYHSSLDYDYGYASVICLATDGTTVLGTFDYDWTQVASQAFTLEELSDWVPALTRFFKITTTSSRVSGTSMSNNDNYWDNFTLEISDDPITDWDIQPQVSQLGIYAIANAPAEEAQSTQMGIMAVGAAETASGFHDVLAQQLGVYALVKGTPDRRIITAWTFTQDDHDFYVLNIGSTATLVYDTLTKQWSDWRSPGYNYWRAVDGVAWEGYNVAIDPLSNKIWEIDPIGRLDYETTPIRSVVTGMLSKRYRKHMPIYMAELAVSEADPPSGIDASTVGISLRTYTQAGTSAVDHGEVTGEGTGEDITVRWYGLGLAKAPGHVFEIIDTGYARRIDGFDIDIGDFNGSD